MQADHNLNGLAISFYCLFRTDFDRATSKFKYLDQYFTNFSNGTLPCLRVALAENANHVGVVQHVGLIPFKITILVLASINQKQIPFICSFIFDSKLLHIFVTERLYYHWVDQTLIAYFFISFKLKNHRSEIVGLGKRQPQLLLQSLE